VEIEKCFKRMPGEPLGAPWSAQTRHDVLAAEYVMEQDLEIVRREEWMCVEAAKKGSVLVEGEEYEPSLVDYGRRAQNTAVLIGADKWDVLPKDSKKPEDDLRAWCALAKMPVNVIVMNSVTYALFISFDCIRATCDTRFRGTESTLKVGAQSFEVAQLMGYYNNIAIWAYDGEYEGENEDMVKYFDDGEMVLGNTNHGGFFCYGAIRDPRAGLMATERFAKNWLQEEPPAEFVMTQAAPLPVDKHPDRIVYRKVF